MTDETDRPLIWIGRADYGRLLRAMDRLAVQAPEVSAFLSRELDRAIVRPESDLPRTVVRMGSRVLFRRAEDTPSEWGELVYPDQVPVDGQITVASPLGTALLGLREGARMPYIDADGITRCLSVERVLPA
ncbi:MAG TPA: GreA/GreB family elongation factor [Azospirillum sp.]|nr:GreA/GreB family elongation factor [Azospirillum sp.]